MNNYIFYHILLDIKREIQEKYYKNVMLNRLEEYIEWFKYSIKRFCNTSENDNLEYSRYLISCLEIIQKLQSNLLLDEVDKSIEYLNEYIKYYKKYYKNTFTSEKI